MALGLHHGERMPVSVAKHVVGASAILLHHFIANGVGIGRTPALVSQHSVDEDAGERFVSIHVRAHWFCEWSFVGEVFVPDRSIIARAGETEQHKYDGCSSGRPYSDHFRWPVTHEMRRQM